MEAQTGRYRLGLASNLTAKRGCLEEMTPFQALNYNQCSCALRNAHILPRQTVCYEALAFAKLTSDTCFHNEVAIESNKDDLVGGTRSRIVTFTHRTCFEPPLKHQCAEVISLSCSL